MAGLRVKRDVVGFGELPRGESAEGAPGNPAAALASMG